MEKIVLKPKFGIVAMIDALGVRNASIEESIDFITSVESVTNDMPDFMAGFLAQSPEKKRKFEIEPPEIVTFGDTIVFSWEMNPKELDEYLPDVGFFLTFLMISGLENKMALRGAISVGDYIQNGSTILGPAVADVAAWYDSPEMMGIIATPRCGQFLSGIHEAKPLTSFEFFKYLVPLKNGISKELWVVAWPEQLTIFGEESKTPMQHYHKLIQKFPMPKGVEEKYFNTEKFARSFLPQKTPKK